MANEHPKTLDKNSVCYWSSTGCFVSHLNLTGRNVQEDVLSKFNVLSEPYEHTEPKVLVKSQNIQAGNCKRVKCDTQKRGSYPYAKNKGIFTMMVVYLEHLCLLTQNTVAASGPVCKALPNGNPSLRPPRDDGLQCLFFTHSFTQMHTHVHIPLCLRREENRFHHSYFYALQTTAESFLNDFLHDMDLGFSEEPCLVFSLKTCPHARKKNPAGQSGFTVTFQSPLHLCCPLSLLHSLLASRFQSESLVFNEANFGVKMRSNGTVFHLKWTWLFRCKTLASSTVSSAPS